MNVSLNTETRLPAVLIVFNPLSGRGRAGRYAALAKQKLEAHNWQVKAVVPTEYAGHAERVVAAQWCHQVDLIVVVGGDGTLRELVTGLIRAQARTCLGFIPMGNANVMAREFGIPLQPERAIDCLLHSRIITPDLGVFTTEEATDRYFLAMIEIGQGAKIVHLVDQLRHGKLKTLYRLWGDLVYLIAGLLAFASRRNGAVRFRFSTDDSANSLQGYLAVISLIKTYSKGWAMTPDAVFDDGKLNYVISHSDSPALFFRHLLAAVVRKPFSHPFVHYGDGTAFELNCEGQVCMQADGDVVAPSAALSIRVLPAAYRLRVPA